jgi:glycosyltransferase involved in cell wall biosynthesis
MDLPKISIITPSYNQGQFIEETILSILNQNYPNLEYLIIDGKSTDSTIEIIKKYEQKIFYWVSEKDSGQSEAINKGFQKATGEIVCWLNSDDILMPNALNEVAAQFIKNKELILLNGQTVLIDKDSNIISSHFILKQKKWYAIRGIFYINQPAMFWRRNIFDAIGFLRNELHTVMDKEFLIRVFEKNYKIAYSGKLLAGFRLHNQSKSSLGKESKIYQKDCKELLGLYGKDYTQEPNLVYKMIYRAEKLIKGVYLRKLKFTLQWKGKNVNKLNSNNCSYIS